MKEARICLCRDTMKRLFKHLQRSKSGRNLWKVILFRTKDQFPLKKGGRQKARTAKQIRATKKLIAFNKRRRARR